jgi:hypothetical protein
MSNILSKTLYLSRLEQTSDAQSISSLPSVQSWSPSQRQLWKMHCPSWHLKLKYININVKNCHISVNHRHLIPELLLVAGFGGTIFLIKLITTIGLDKLSYKRQSKYKKNTWPSQTHSFGIQAGPLLSNVVHANWVALHPISKENGSRI